MISRRGFLSLAAAAAAGGIAYPTLVEPRWLDLTHTPIQLERNRRADAIRVLHLADLHASMFVSPGFIDHAIRMGLEQKPDFACLTGDFITHRDFDAEAYVHSLRRLTGAVPAYAVLGNHDGGKWAPARGGFPDHRAVERILLQSGVRLLHNRSEAITVRGRELCLAGVGDLWSEEIDGAAAFTNVGNDAPTVLLSHNPDSKEQLAAFHWRLMLCGHTHGGQVLIPFEGPRYAPVRDKNFVAGLKPWRERQIFVTRGVGNIGGIRFRCRPEISMLALV